MSYPVELLGGVSALGPGQLDVGRKAPFTAHLFNVPVVGAKTPRRIGSASGLWFGDNAPVGDFQGTAQARNDGGVGSGGPALLTHSPTGTDTVVAAGYCRTAAAGASQLLLDFSVTLKAGHTYGVKVRSMRGASITVNGLSWTAATLELDSGGGNLFAGFTLTGDDWARVSAGGQTGYYRITTKPDNDTIGLSADAVILSTVDVATSVNIVIYPSTQAQRIAAATWHEGTKTLEKTAAFGSYTPGADDTLEVLSGTGYPHASPSCTRVMSKTDADNIVVADGGIADDATTDIEAILWKRTSFESAAVDLGTTTIGSATTTIELSSALSFTPQIGDIYYVYDLGGGLDEPSAENAPESVPTATALNTTFCPWPFFAFSRSTESSYAGYEGVAIYPSSADKTEMHTCWWGTFSVPPETLVYGDKYVYELFGDYTYTVTPFIFEVLLIPDFDPVADWDESFAVDHASRLAGKSLFFQSPVIVATGTHSVQIRLELGANGLNVQGVPNTYGYSALAQFLVGPSSGTPSNPPALDSKVGPYSRAINRAVLDLSVRHTRWQILVKTEHPSRAGQPGFHGYYAGEPFSCTTGNGGSLLCHTGNQGNVALPRSPRTRWTRWSLDYIPGGNY